MKCKKILNNNKQCEAFAQNNKDFCFRHDPEQNAFAIQSSRKGGENRLLKGNYGDPIKLETPEDVKKFLGVVINSVWSEGIPVQVGSSMGFLTRCWLDAYEASDVIKRLDEIEEKLESYLKKSSER